MQERREWKGERLGEARMVDCEGTRPAAPLCPCQLSTVSGSRFGGPTKPSLGHAQCEVEGASGSRGDISMQLSCEGE